MLGTVITYFSFFTILTNLLIALVFTAIAFGPEAGWGQWFRSPSVQAATAVYIAIVGIVYQLLLRQLWNPQGAQWVADVLLHSVIPIGYVVYWLLFGPRTGLNWKDCRRLADLSRRVPGVHSGAGSGERALSLSICRCERAGLWRRASPGRGFPARFSRYGPAGCGLGAPNPSAL